MSRVDRWMEHASSRSGDRASLEESILGDRTWRYAFHRLRFVLGARLLSFLVHLVEFALLYRVFIATDLAGSLVAHNSFAVAGAAYWGCLEIMRARIRATPDHRTTAAESSRWLRWAWRAAWIVAAGATLTVVAKAVWRTVTPVDAYVAVVALRFCVDLVVRTYRSGIAATRRIYRPMTASIGIELVSLSSAALLWPRLGAWSIAAAVALSTLASRLVVVVYASRAYRTTRTSAPRLTGSRRRAARPLNKRDLFWAALAGASTRVGSLLLIAAVALSKTAGSGVISLHLLAPGLAAAASWPHAYYLDFVRTAAGTGRALGDRLLRSLFRVALAVAALIWIPTALALAATGTSMLTCGAVLVLLLTQSTFGLVQLRAFARYGFYAAAAGAAVLVATTMPVLWSGAGDDVTTLLCVAATALCLAASTVHLFPVVQSPPRHQHTLIAPYDWLHELSRTESTVVAGCLDIASDVNVAAVARRIAVRLEAQGHVAILGRRRVCWYQRTSDAAAPLGQCDVAVETAGLATAIDVLDVPRSGLGAINGALARKWIDIDSSSVSSEKTLVSRFSEQFPDGLVAVIGDTPSRELIALTADERRSIWRDAELFARGGRPRRSRWAVSALCQRGAVTAIFAIPRTADTDLRRAWAELVRAHNWRAAIAPPARLAPARQRRLWALSTR